MLHLVCESRPHLLQSIGNKVLRPLVCGIGKNGMIDHLGHPAIIALVVIGPRLFHHGIDTTHHIHIAFGRLNRRKLVQGRRITDEPA